MKVKHLILMVMLAGGLHAQAFRLSKPTLDETPVYRGLASNGVTEIVAQGRNTLWLATGGGLSRSDDFGNQFYSYYPGEAQLARGGISAIAVLDSIIWVAGVFDSTTLVGSMQTGGGLACSRDSGRTWTYVPQPIDGADDRYETWNGQQVNYLPVVTPVNNTTWDIALCRQNDDTVWVYIASWAGGFRRSADYGQTWQRLPLPSDNHDFLYCSDSIDFQINPRDPPYGNHNHKGFSVLAYGDTIWMGSANGINLGIFDRNSGCLNWQKFSHRNSGIAGNFVVALARQLHRGRETIWAATLSTESAGEYRAVSKTADGGRTWTTTLIGERPYNFAFHDSVVFVCTENGLFKSLDGEHWAVYQSVENIYSIPVYAACVDRREGRPYLWIGTADGVAKTADDGLSWTTYRSALSTRYASQPAIYAYPNPFSPTRHNRLANDGHVRIQYYLDSLSVPSEVLLEVYDFGMDRVYRGAKRWVSQYGDHNEIWSGRNMAGELVANGAYFCKLTRKKDDHEIVHWTKLIVVK